MIRVRLYTEDRPSYTDNVRNILAEEGIEGFTIFDTLGSWKGVLEDSICVEIILPPLTKVDLIPRIAQKIAIANNQESVMVCIEHNIGIEMHGKDGPQ